MMHHIDKIYLLRGFLWILLLWVLAGCSSEPVEPITFFSLPSISYDANNCTLTINGTIDTGVVSEELGVVYSFDNPNPSFDDIRVVLRGANVAINIDEYRIGQQFYFRVYTIVDGEVMFSKSRSFIERLSSTQLFLFNAFFDCFSDVRRIVVEPGNICNTTIEVCMDNNLTTDCQEILIVGEEEIFVPVNNDAVEVVLSLFTAENPDSALLTMPIGVPNFDRQQITEQGTMPIAVAVSRQDLD